MIETFGIMCRRREELLERKRKYEDQIEKIDEWVTARDKAIEMMDKMLAPYECPYCCGSGTASVDSDEPEPCNICHGTGIICV